MSWIQKLTDFANAGIGTFVCAPPILTVTGMQALNGAFQHFLQGLVGIVLMFLTRWVARFFEKKPAAPVAPVRPVEPPKPIFINSDKSLNNGKEEKNSEAQSLHIDKAESDPAKVG